MYQVKKSDGSMEPFDRTKIISGVTKAGALPEEAEKVAMEVEKWVATLGANAMVDAVNLKTKVLETLRSVNETAASAFESYKK